MKVVGSILSPFVGEPRGRGGTPWAQIWAQIWNAAASSLSAVPVGSAARWRRSW